MSRIKHFIKKTPILFMAYKNTKTLISFLGIDFYKFYTNIISIPWYIKDYKKLKKQLGNYSNFPVTQFRPYLFEKKDSSGTASGDYFHQDLYVARRIFESNPEKHVDVGSRIDGFVAHVACFRDIEVFDIRPLKSQIESIKFVQADLMQMKPELFECTDSLSCLHTIEHFGLGRYGDTIDAEGHLKGLECLYKMLKTGGRFYLSTPIGSQRIEFNAHRVFSVQYLLDLFKDKYEVESFSYVNDKGLMHKKVPLNQNDIISNFGCFYGCGIFELIKK